MSFSYAKYCAALAGLYWDCVKDSAAALVKNYLLVIGGMLLYAAFLLLSALAAPLGIVGGFIASLALFCALTIYYGWLSDAACGRTIRLREIFEFDSSIFFSLISVGFVLWIFSLLVLQPFSAAFKDQPIGLVAAVLVFIFLNPLPEIIQSQRSDGWTSVRESFQFVTSNWIEWFLPAAALAWPWAMTDSGGALMAVGNAEPLFPFAVVIRASVELTRELAGISGTTQTVLAILIAHWFMLFRAILFRELGQGSRRQRLFQMQTR